MTAQQPIVVVAPDSFKGSMSAREICVALSEGVGRVWQNVEVRARPMADGGEGTLDAVLAAVGDAGERRTMRVTGASGLQRDAHYGLITRDGERTAIIEAAEIVGITDGVAMRAPVIERTTTGVGEMIRELLDQGIDRFMIGLGGSSTNDAGAGLLSALGFDLLDADRKAVAATPKGLDRLARVDATNLDHRLSRASITIMSDVSNPLTGTEGATAVFGPQKGVASDEVASLDLALGRFATAVENAIGKEAAQRPGAGAAGGLGFALQLIGARFESGAEVVANLIGLDGAFDGADWAIAGEGRSDRQTLLGKAPWIVAQRAARSKVPVSLLSGSIDASALGALGEHFAGCFALPSGPMTLEACMADAPRLLADRAEQMARLFAASLRE
ncbi:MAG TPA: glycerate kinase [Casimicrobiaceae bacterium]|nr:glycerate kinase [Casimicrobiaceae bacterium]